MAFENVYVEAKSSNRIMDKIAEKLNDIEVRYGEVEVVESNVEREHARAEIVVKY